MIGGLLKILAFLISLLVGLVLTPIFGDIEATQWIAVVVPAFLWLVLFLFAHIIEKLEKIERNTTKTKENTAYCADYLEEIRNHLLNSDGKNEN